MTNDDTVFISLNVQKVDSLYDLDQDSFGARPEISYFVKQSGKKPEPITT